MKIFNNIRNKTYTLFTLIFLLTLSDYSILHNNKRNSTNFLKFDGMYICNNVSGSTEDEIISDCLRFYRDSTVLCLFLPERTLDSVEKWMNKNFAKKYDHPVLFKYKQEGNEISFVKGNNPGLFRELEKNDTGFVKPQFYISIIYKGIIEENKLTLKVKMSSPGIKWKWNKNDTLRTYHYIKAKEKYYSYFY